MERLGRSAPRAGAAPEVDDEREADAHDPCCSFEMKQLFGEFHMLYQERLRQLEIMDDTQEEVLRMKVRLLQSYVMDLSDQNSVLVQTMEELERESEWKVATLEAELQEYVARVTEHKQENSTLQITKANLQKEISRPSLAQRPVPTEHLSGSTAAQITVTPPQQMMEQEELRIQLASKEQLIHQLNVHLREANHSQEKSKAEFLEKEAKIRELQEIITDLHHEISLKELEAVNQLEENHLLETTVQSLRQVLDAQEQRIYQLQTKQTERQAELEQKCSRIQQLEQDLEASGRLQEESQRQLGECNACLAQVAGENEALRGHWIEQMLEAQETKNQLPEVEVVTMRSKYSMAQKEGPTPQSCRAESLAGIARSFSFAECKPHKTSLCIVPALQNLSMRLIICLLTFCSSPICSVCSRQYPNVIRAEGPVSYEHRELETIVRTAEK